MFVYTPPPRSTFNFLLKTVFILPLILFFIYLSWANPQFPMPPEDSLQSFEPADSENILRRAYFTNKTREEVLNHYEKQFEVKILGLSVPQFRLNYPPEEANVIIRDQTRSTFLEEIIHPLRESLFINGFEPKNDKDKILIENRLWRQKITVRYVPSNSVYRIIIGLLSVVLVYLTAKAWFNTLKYFKTEVIK